MDSTLDWIRSDNSIDGDTICWANDGVLWNTASSLAIHMLQLHTVRSKTSWGDFRAASWIGVRSMVSNGMGAPGG